MRLRQLTSCSWLRRPPSQQLALSLQLPPPPPPLCTPPPQAEFGGLYTDDNVVLTATHTHASAGGFLEHFLYHITSLGFVKQTFDALADGDDLRYLG